MPDPRIHVDFNGIQQDGRLDVLRRHADDPSAVLPGAVVQLWDEDGNSALGRVIEIGERDLAQVAVLLDTWHGRRPAEVPHYYELTAPGKDFWAGLSWTGTSTAAVWPQPVRGSYFIVIEPPVLRHTFRDSYELQTVSGLGAVASSR